MLKKLFQSTAIKYMLAFVVVGLIAITVIAIIFGETETPPPPTIDQVEIDHPAQDRLDPSTPTLTPKPLTLNFTGENSIKIIQAGIYQVGQTSQAQVAATAKMIETIINRYSLESIYDEQGVAIYTSEDHTLAISLPENTINFTRENPTDLATTIDQNQAIAAAYDFLKIILPDHDLSPLTDNIEYFKGGYHLETSSAINASVVLIPFSYTLEGIPLYSEQKPEPFATFMINTNLQIQKASIQTLMTVPEKIQTAKIISLKDALDNITNHKNSELISFTETNQQLTQAPTLHQTTQGTLTSAQLEYRLDPKTKLIYPFYRFEGDFIDVDDTTFKGEIITPAVKLER